MAAGDKRLVITEVRFFTSGGWAQVEVDANWGIAIERKDGTWRLENSRGSRWASSEISITKDSTLQQVAAVVRARIRSDNQDLADALDG